MKESDRLAAVYDGLIANGVDARIEGDDLTVRGAAGAANGGGVVAAYGSPLHHELSGDGDGDAGARDH